MRPHIPSGRPARRARTLAQAVVATVAIAAGACVHLEPTICGSDNDCKSRRVCDQGHCAWPAGMGPGGEAAPAGPPAASLPALATPAAGQPTTVEPARAMFRLGPQHRGRTPYPIPARRPTVAWAYQTGGPISSSPALLDDGGIVVGLARPPRADRRTRRHARLDLHDRRHHLQLARRGCRRRDLPRLRRRSPVRVRSRAQPQTAVGVPGRVMPAQRRHRAGRQPLRRGRGPHHRPRRHHLHRRRRHLRHQPRRHPALALRDRRARRVGPGRDRGWHRDRRLPGRPGVRRRPQRDQALGLPRGRRRRIGARRSATTGPSISAPTTARCTP